jgi:hypothetical protein
MIEILLKIVGQVSHPHRLGMIQGPPGKIATPEFNQYSDPEGTDKAIN